MQGAPVFGAYVASGSREWLVLDMDRETVAGLIAMIRRIEGTCIVLAGLDSAYIEDKQPEFVREARRYYTRCKEVDDLLDVQGDKLLKIAVYDFKGSEGKQLSPPEAFGAWLPGGRLRRKMDGHQPEGGR